MLSCFGLCSIGIGPYVEYTVVVYAVNGAGEGLPKNTTLHTKEKGIRLLLFNKLSYSYSSRIGVLSFVRVGSAHNGIHRCII